MLSPVLSTDDLGPDHLFRSGLDSNWFEPVRIPTQFSARKEQRLKCALPSWLFLASFSSIPGQVGLIFGNPHREPPSSYHGYTLMRTPEDQRSALSLELSHIHEYNEALAWATGPGYMMYELPIIVCKTNGVIAAGFGLLGSAYGALIASSIERRSWEKMYVHWPRPHKAVDNQRSVFSPQLQPVIIRSIFMNFIPTRADPKLG